MDNKSALCMTKYGKDTNNTRHINRGVHLVRNGENCEMHKIEWCEGGLQLSDIATKNVGETNLNPRMRYIMVRLDNWERAIAQEGWQDIVQSMEQEFYMNRLYWVEDSTQPVLNFCIKFDTRKEHWKLFVIEGKQCCSKWKIVLIENHVNR